MPFLAANAARRTSIDAVLYRYVEPGAFGADERQVFLTTERWCAGRRRGIEPRCLPRSGRHRQSSRRRTHAPVRVFRRVHVPEHDLVEIDRLGLGAPVAVDA